MVALVSANCLPGRRPHDSIDSARVIPGPRKSALQLGHSRMGRIAVLVACGAVRAVVVTPIRVAISVTHAVRTEKDLRRTAAAKTSQDRAPKSKESLHTTGMRLTATNPAHRDGRAEPWSFLHTAQIFHWAIWRTPHRRSGQRLLCSLGTSPLHHRRGELNSTTQTVRMRRTCHFTGGGNVSSVRHYTGTLNRLPFTPRV
jgi:hypothetical protein